MDQAEQTAANPPADKTILLVEPDINIILLVTRILSPQGFYVLATREGRQALEIYQQQQAEIDLVLVEQNLPGQSGLELIKELLAINPGLAVVLVSGSGAPESWPANTPRRAFLSKPYTPDQLVQCVRDTLKG